MALHLLRSKQAVREFLDGDPLLPPAQFHSAADHRSSGYVSRVAVIKTVSKFMTNEPP